MAIPVCHRKKGKRDVGKMIVTSLIIINLFYALFITSCCTVVITFDWFQNILHYLYMYVVLQVFLGVFADRPLGAPERFNYSQVQVRIQLKKN